MKKRAENKKGALEKGAFLHRFTNPYYSFSLLIRIP